MCMCEWNVTVLLCLSRSDLEHVLSAQKVLSLRFLPVFKWCESQVDKFILESKRGIVLIDVAITFKKSFSEGLLELVALVTNSTFNQPYCCLFVLCSEYWCHCLLYVVRLCVDRFSVWPQHHAEHADVSTEHPTGHLLHPHTGLPHLCLCSCGQLQLHQHRH